MSSARHATRANSRRERAVRPSTTNSATRARLACSKAGAAPTSARTVPKGNIKTAQARGRSWVIVYTMPRRKAHQQRLLCTLTPVCCVGRLLRATGQAQCEVCTPCDAGHEPFGEGCTKIKNQECSTCAAGKFKPGKGSEKCTDCEAGTYQSQPGPLNDGQMAVLVVASCTQWQAGGVIAVLWRTSICCDRPGAVQGLHFVRERTRACWGGLHKNSEPTVCPVPGWHLQTRRWFRRVHEMSSGSLPAPRGSVGVQRVYLVPTWPWRGSPVHRRGRPRVPRLPTRIVLQH